MLAYMGMQDKERIARIGSVDPGSHLGIPFSHVSAKETPGQIRKDLKGYRFDRPR